MSSFTIDISPDRRAAARFVADVLRELRSIEGLSDEVARELDGTQPLTLGRVAEIASMYGYEVRFSLERSARSGI